MQVLRGQAALWERVPWLPGLSATAGLVDEAWLPLCSPSILTEELPSARLRPGLKAFLCSDRHHPSHSMPDKLLH